MTRHRMASVCGFLIATFAGADASAQPLVLTRQDVASYAGARGITTGDFDRDGWIDVAHANIGRNTVTILLNQGGSAPNFIRAFDVAVGLGPFDLTSADFNRDGFLDLAVANADGHTVSILRGRAAGGFTRNDVAVPPGPRGITTADVNEDGRADLVVTGWNNHTIQVLYGNGSGGFANGPRVSGHAAHPQGVAAADFNRDGHLDFVVAHESAGGLALLTGNGGTAFSAQSIAGIANLNVLTTGDFNRDGRPDVVAASSSGNRVAVYLGTSSGLRFNRSYATGASPRGIVARDINYDGALDVITANRAANNVSVLLGSVAAPGSLQPAVAFAAGGGSRAVVAEDFDRDGRIDLATGNQYAAAATVLWNDTAFDKAAYSFGRLSFGTPSNTSGGSTAIPADFNEDGKLDVVVTPDFLVGQVVHVLITDGPVVVLDQPQFYSGKAVGDLNNDGHADVLIIRSFSSFLLWPYLGDGRGGFTRAPETSFPVSMRELTMGDLNADGRLDIAFVGYDPSAGSYFVQVVLGRGDGTFVLGSRIMTSSDYTSAPTLADVNRDGKVDVAVFVLGTLTVFHGDGTGKLQFGSGSTLSFYHLQQIVLADLNHDGFLDAAIGEQGRVRVSLGYAGGFSAPSIIEIQGYGNSGNVAVADINLDGKLDIIGATGYILRGRGDGTFEPQEAFDFDASFIEIADFTRDGLPDIIMPTSNGAYDVIVNKRNSLNHVPTVDAGPDVTFEYADQFQEYAPSIVAVGTDGDLHRLTYQWRDQDGNAVGFGEGRWLTIQGFMHGTYTFTVTVRDGRGGTATDSVRVTITPTKEIVVWSASGFYNGTFAEVPDSTAAGGERGYDRNLGRPKVTAPSPNPTNRIFLGFIADPTQTYKLWVRLKAEGNHWSNDSVWVQFTGSTDTQGNARYRSGTTSGLAVNLEECLGCGVSGWGWEDDGWGAANRNGVLLRFPSGGHQSIVIQTREDGVSIDQVVLSSEKYLTTRPGAAKNDTTILKWTYWQEEG